SRGGHIRSVPSSWYTLNLTGAFGWEASIAEDERDLVTGEVADSAACYSDHLRLGAAADHARRERGAHSPGTGDGHRAARAVHGDRVGIFEAMQRQAVRS